MYPDTKAHLVPSHILFLLWRMIRAQKANIISLITGKYNSRVVAAFRETALGLLRVQCCHGSLVKRPTKMPK